MVITQRDEWEAEDHRRGGSHLVKTSDKVSKGCKMHGNCFTCPFPDCKLEDKWKKPKANDN